MKFDALLFDFDGVLADTERIHHKSWNLTLKPFGIQWDWDYYQRNCVGVADTVLMQKYGFENGPELVRQKQEIFRAELARTNPFPEETQALVADLSRYYLLAVVTSSFRREVVPPLDQAGLSKYFQNVICGDDVKNLKPAPDPYLLAAERLHVRTPLVIEDSASGIAAGKAAGFPVLEIKNVQTTAAEVREFLLQ